MTGTPVETNLAFLPAGSTVQKFLAFLDRFGDGSSLAPLHGVIDTTGAKIDPATSELQAAGNAVSATIASALAGTLNVAATALPLPYGAATAANQVTQATSLSSILAALLAAPTAAQAGPALGPAAALGVVQQDGQQFTVSASSAGPMIGTGANATTGAYAGDGAASVAVQRTDATANATAFEVSDDGVTWTLQNGYQPNSAGNNVEFATQSAGGSYHYPINHKYFRVRLSTFVSGTATAVITLKVAPLPPIAMYVTPSNAGTAATSANQARAIAFTDTQTALAASGTVTNAARATGIAQGSTGLYGYFNVNAFADQAGTLFIEGSIDNFVSTTFPMNGTAGTALTAGGSVSAKIAVTMPYMRTRYTNGTTAQTKFSITSSFSAA